MQSHIRKFCPYGEHFQKVEKARIEQTLDMVRKLGYSKYLGKGDKGRQALISYALHASDDVDPIEVINLVKNDIDTRLRSQDGLTGLQRRALERQSESAAAAPIEELAAAEAVPLPVQDVAEQRVVDAPANLSPVPLRNLLEVLHLTWLQNLK